MDQQTRQALKTDKFVTTTTHGIEWANEHRQAMIRSGAIALGALLLVIAGVVIYNMRSSAAAAAYGAAMETLSTPLLPAGEPGAGVKTFASNAERAKAANAEFVAVANRYGMTPSGEDARYFAGLTYEDMNQYAQAEAELKKVAGSWNSNLASLANFALAQLYRDTGRDALAIDTYQALSKKPTTTVPYGVAQLTLADLYNDEGKSDEAKKIYASLKDKDAKGPAGELAAQKLNPQPAVGPLGQ